MEQVGEASVSGAWTAQFGQQTLEIVVSGCDSPEQAETAFRREIVKLIDVKTNGLVADVSTR